MSTFWGSSMEKSILTCLHIVIVWSIFLLPSVRIDILFLWKKVYLYAHIPQEVSRGIINAPTDSRSWRYLVLLCDRWKAYQLLNIYPMSEKNTFELLSQGIEVGTLYRQLRHRITRPQKSLLWRVFCIVNVSNSSTKEKYEILSLFIHIIFAAVHFEKKCTVS